MKNLRYLFKSQLKLAVKCPTTFSYARKPELYKDSITVDNVMVMLPEGGYQVRGITKKPYPDGVEIDY